MNRKYYAAHSHMGLNYTYDSPCWLVYVFESKSQRDQWVHDHEYDQNTGNYVAMKVTRKVAEQIAPELRREEPENCHRVVCRFGYGE